MVGIAFFSEPSACAASTASPTTAASSGRRLCGVSADARYEFEDCHPKMKQPTLSQQKA